MLSIIVNILLFVLVIGVLTFVHELGHFIVAKLIGATVEEFSIGFGPKLLGKKIKGTLYCLRILPLGGYVRILGDGDPENQKEKDELKSNPGNLRNKPRLGQAAVMLAGVTMNVLFAALMYFIVLGNSDWKMVLDWRYENFNPTGATITREVEGDVKYTELTQDGNAQKAGLPNSGTIKSIDGKEVVYSKDVSKLLKEDTNGKAVLEICNDTCNLYTVDVSDKGTIGVLISSNYSVIISYEGNKILSGFSHLVNTVRLIGIRFGDLFSEAKTTGDYSELSNSVSGPVGIYFLIDYFKGLGFVTFLSVMGDLSLSLAIMNLLPIPALDGGRVLIVAIEGIIRKELNEKVKTAIINWSFIFLMILVIFIMIKDVLNVENIKNMFR